MKQVSFKNPIHSKKYLIEGELHSWKGEVSNVYSSIYSKNIKGEKKPTLLGSKPVNSSCPFLVTFK